MTRVRLYALAVLVGMCCLRHTPTYAQSGPAAPPYGIPGPNFAGNGGDLANPYQTPLPPEPDPCYVNPENVDTGLRQVGPLIRTDGAFLRVEYLNWTIGRPGNGTLGAPVLGVENPKSSFLIFSPGTTAPIGFATVPSTEGFNLGSMSGVQVTGGLSFIDDGSVEVSAFMLARKSTGIFRSNFGNTFLPVDLNFDLVIDPGEGLTLPNFLATSTLFNGAVSDHLFLYNVSFKAEMQSQLWGGEANYFYDMDAVGVFQFRPLAGVRYINLTERLTQTGVFQDLLPGDLIVSTIDSRTRNDLWGAQIGARAQFVSQYLEVGLTPKLLFLGNTFTSTVSTNHLRTNFDPFVSTSNHSTTFGFGSDVAAYAQINLTPHFAIRGGYNLLWLGRVTRPDKDIYYNDSGPTAPPGFVSKVVYSDVLITGFSVGAEFHW